MKKLIKKTYIQAIVFVVIALVSGVFAREYTKLMHLTDIKELFLLHSHLLVLGGIVPLGLILFLKLKQDENIEHAKEFENVDAEDIPELSRCPFPQIHSTFTQYFWSWNIGLSLFAISMFLKGMYISFTVMPPIYVTILAGISHIILAFGIYCIFRLVYLLAIKD